MKNRTPLQISIITSAAIAVFLFLILLITFGSTHPVLSIWPILLITALTFLAALIIIKFSFDKFIHQKIKLIYKIINTDNTDTGKSSGNIKIANFLGDVELEVRDWKNQHSEELAKLRDMENYRREFVGNVSHELKTPLFNIQGYLETLINGGLHDENINIEYLRKAEKNVSRLGNIIADLEMISQFENDKIELAKQKFNITELIKETIESLEIQSDLSDVKLRLNDEHDYPFMVLADRKAIRQVLTNLLVNSIRYGKANGKTIVSIYDMDENIRVEVTDNGIGIETHHLPRLFERFYRVEKNRSRTKGGTGLGLAIVKHILEAHEQNITVKSKPDVGTTFGFTLQKV